jgi:hypothetical protein
MMTIMIRAISKGASTGPYYDWYQLRAGLGRGAFLERELMFGAVAFPH